MSAREAAPAVRRMRRHGVDVAAGVSRRLGPEGAEAHRGNRAAAHGDEAAARAEHAQELAHEALAVAEYPAPERADALRVGFARRAKLIACHARTSAVNFRRRKAGRISSFASRRFSWPMSSSRLR